MRQVRIAGVRYTPIRCGRKLFFGLNSRWASPRCVRAHGHRGKCAPTKKPNFRVDLLRRMESKGAVGPDR